MQQYPQWISPSCLPRSGSDTPSDGAQTRHSYQSYTDGGPLSHTPSLQETGVTVRGQKYHKQLAEWSVLLYIIQLEVFFILVFLKLIPNEKFSHFSFFVLEINSFLLLSIFLDKVHLSMKVYFILLLTWKFKKNLFVLNEIKDKEKYMLYYQIKICWRVEEIKISFSYTFPLFLVFIFQFVQNFFSGTKLKINC